MIIFAADNHYEVRPGAMLNQCLQASFDIHFVEDEWSVLENPALMGACSLLMLNMISGTGKAPLPGEAVERQVRAYLERGAPLLLLHGSSAAFWQWDWWRKIVGYRWVRGADADGFEASTHPHHACRLEVAKSRHPLCRLLKAVDLPEDEIYIRLEQTCPTITLMETTIPEGTFPQCYLCTSPWGGTIIGFIPGHKPEVVQHPDVVANIACLMRYLLKQA